MLSDRENLHLVSQASLRKEESKAAMACHSHWQYNIAAHCGELSSGSFDASFANRLMKLTNADENAVETLIIENGNEQNPKTFRIKLLEVSFIRPSQSSAPWRSQSLAPAYVTP